MITDSSFPALYRAADQASLTAQRRYLRIVRFDLLTLVLGALFTSLPLGESRWPAAAGTFLLVLSAFLTVIISQKNYEDKWYGGRAMAESIKSLAWKYMTGAEPFQLSSRPQEADHTFVEHIRDILEQADQLAVPVGGPAATESQISDDMRQVRNLSLERRQDIYHKDRIQDQRKWYSNKARANQTSERRLFYAVIASQVIAVGCGLLATFSATMPLGFVGVFSASAAALLAWLQVKRHQELSQAYGVAAHELGLISNEIAYISEDDDFADFVADAEAAISREHTLWAARRGVSLRNPVRSNR